MKLPLRKENDALDERDDRSDLAETGRLPWKDDRAEGGRKLMFLASPLGGLRAAALCGGVFWWQTLPRVGRVAFAAAGVVLRP